MPDAAALPPPGSDAGDPRLALPSGVTRPPRGRRHARLPFTWELARGACTRPWGQHRARQTQVRQERAGEPAIHLEMEVRAGDTVWGRRAVRGGLKPCEEPEFYPAGSWETKGDYEVCEEHPKLAILKYD